MEDNSGTLGKRYLTVSDISDKFRVAKITVYRWVSKNTIPHFFVGKSLRFDPEKVDQWATALSSDE